MPVGNAAAVVKRDRAIVLAGLVSLTGLAWAYTTYLVSGKGGMGMQSSMAMPQASAWTALDVTFAFVMWAVMMVAMMVPSAIPMVLTFATVQRKHRPAQGPLVPTGIFVLGYLVVWGGFAALAALAQWGLHAGALLDPMTASTGPLLGGALLVAAGVYQWTPIKHGCLTRCRTPLGFLLTEWRDSRLGALVMGLRHGVFCLGCCWVLMSLMFALGVMNLLWIAVLAAFVLVEKVVPAGHRVSQVSGLLFLGWGLWIVAGGLL